MITKKQVEHIAKLAKIKLLKKQIKIYQKQIGEILHYVDMLKKVNTKDVPACIGGTALKNVFKPDNICLTSEQTRKKLLDLAPKRKKDLIKTKSPINK